MPQNYKGEFIFKCQEQGWSETWYHQEDSTQAAYSNMRAVAQARADCTGQHVILQAIRVSDEAIIGDSFLWQADWTTSIPGKSLNNLPADLSETAWLARVEATSLYRRSLWLRGLPDAYTRRDTAGQMLFDPNFKPAFDNLKIAMFDNNFRLKVLSKNKVTNLSGNVTGIAPVNPPANTLWDLTVGTAGYQQGDEVRIRGGKGSGLEPFRGIFTIQSVTPPTTVTIRLATVTAQPVILAFPNITKRTYEYPKITSVTPLRVRSRKTGRAFFVPRGRA